MALAMRVNGCVATFKKRQERDWSSRPGFGSCRHLEQVMDELNLLPNIRTAHPPRLPLPDHVHSLVALDRSPRRLKNHGTPAWLSRVVCSVILLHDVVQVLDRLEIEPAYVDVTVARWEDFTGKKAQRQK